MKKAILDSLSLINYSFDKGVKNVVIKPNMCYYWDYSTGHTTDPRFVGALIELLREQVSSDVGISIVESDASAMRCEHAFRFLGYDKLAKEYSVRLINLSNEESDNAKVAVAGETFDVMVPRSIQTADLKINVPKIKYARQEVKITCALKNIYGCNPDSKKYMYHQKLAATIVALNKAMKFDLSIIDGNIVAGASTRKLGLVMASLDPVAIDFAASRIAGVNPNSIDYFKLAAKEGLGQASFDPKGESPDYFGGLYPRKKMKDKMMAQVFRLVLRIGLGPRLGLS
jgi:uncharacterized protein (DUF362 family)